MILVNNTCFNIYEKVLALSETFGRADKPWSPPSIDGYQPWKVERSGESKGGGGLCIFYRAELEPHCWNPSVSEDLEYISTERQWLLIDNGQKKLAFLHCYIACQSSTNNNFLTWNNDLFHLLTMEVCQLKSQGFLTLCMGDFNSRVGQIGGLEGNTPDVNRNESMFMNFISNANLVIINTLPQAKGLFTRFNARGEGSILDYGLINKESSNIVTSFTIDADARHEFGSDHALLMADITFGYKPRMKWGYSDVLNFNICESTNYEMYQDVLDHLSRKIPMRQFERMSVESQLDHIVTSIIEAGKNTVGIKTKKSRKRNQLPRALVEKIRIVVQTTNTFLSKLVVTFNILIFSCCISAMTCSIIHDHT